MKHIDDEWAEIAKANAKIPAGTLKMLKKAFYRGAAVVYNNIGEANKANKTADGIKWAKETLDAFHKTL